MLMLKTKIATTYASTADVLQNKTFNEHEFQKSGFEKNVFDSGVGEWFRGQTANKRFPMQSVRNLIMDILYFTTEVQQKRNIGFNMFNGEDFHRSQCVT